MTETHRSDPRHRHTHHTPHRAHAHRNGTAGSHAAGTEPVWYFLGIILLLIGIRLLRSPLLPAAIGGLGLVILSVAKRWRFKPGFIAAGICLFGMTFLYIWQWLQHYLGALLTDTLISDRILLTGGIAQGATLALLAWAHHRMLNAIYHRSGRKGFIRKSYVILIRLLFYFHLFLLVVFILGALSGRLQTLSGLAPKDTALIAGLLALVAAGIPALVYLSRNSPDAGHRHHHHRHRTQPSPRPGKNDEIV